ncbi:MAG: hypothetical protein HQL25_09005 [Candidatus Omnitrophica bacterium]|nr:hypothetical protein [Candidatus Omnitrophota bacterium]
MKIYKHIFQYSILFIVLYFCVTVVYAQTKELKNYYTSSSGVYQKIHLEPYANGALPTTCVAGTMAVERPAVTPGDLVLKICDAANVWQNVITSERFWKQQNDVVQLQEPSRIVAFGYAYVDDRVKLQINGKVATTQNAENGHGGLNYVVGNKAGLWDTNIAEVIGIRGYTVSDGIDYDSRNSSTHGGLQLGQDGPIIYGISDGGQTGRIGIGNTEPAVLLHLGDADARYMSTLMKDPLTAAAYNKGLLIGKAGYGLYLGTRSKTNGHDAIVMWGNGQSKKLHFAKPKDISHVGWRMDDSMTLTADGKVGIGFSAPENPKSALDVNGDISVNAVLSPATVFLNTGYGLGAPSTGMFGIAKTDGFPTSIRNSKLLYKINNSDILSIVSTGNLFDSSAPNIGIGTIVPQSTIDVSGGVKVGKTGGYNPDTGVACNEDTKGAIRYYDFDPIKEIQICNGVSWDALPAMAWSKGMPCGFWTDDPLAGKAVVSCKDKANIKNDGCPTDKGFLRAGGTYPSGKEFYMCICNDTSLCNL